MRIDRHHPTRTEQQRVAIGSGPSNRLSAQVAIGARTILDHDRLTQRIGQRRRHRTRNQISRAAGREIDHHAQRPGRKTGLRCNWRPQSKR